ncbi:putative D-isomer specific 2-hydroxyacid dehydrogenase [Halobacteriovorax marinus SJ]|uniref:D-isomer specific 2-hydroxyacid dehydrogenase n=1 Tax=Halobacteriovorax marinus (strain ATCC BAA-682 / DSM 15412 / SJ) TaxID=862908 RepID=E1X1V2_HALMS|nr:NAD(P)-dependent oxidoreductase [Halobacteriovorax marinus]CBW26612.1 putative D-isomer specific 2-hydroxyacid dehydrogenase [Halobacteriovorax marinus SJ]
MKVGIFSEKIMNLYREGSFSFDAIKLDGVEDERITEMNSLIVGSLKNDVVEKCAKLEDIFIPFTGRNGFDENFINERGINIHSTSIHAKFVAERALSLGLSLLGRIVEYDQKLREGRWSRRNFDDRTSWDSMFNKRVGIFGYGEIGKCIANLVAPFNCEVRALSRSTKENVINTSSLTELVESSDIIFICVPLTDETRGVIDKSILDLMRDKILINIARGSIVNEEDLFNSLKEKSLLGYGSDVWFNYPDRESDEAMPSRFPIQNERVVMTPHCGGFAIGAERMRYLDTLRQVEEVFLQN